jgi:hypothetical protein
LVIGPDGGLTPGQTGRLIVGRKLTDFDFDLDFGGLLLLVFAKYNQNDQVKENEMGVACSTNGGEEERV